MPFSGQSKDEKIEAWRIQGEAELTRLGALADPQLGAEVLRRGFAELPAEGERTRIGLANSLCPDAPAIVGGDDIGVVQQYSDLVAPVLGRLENAGLLLSQVRGRSELRFYHLTGLGRAALTDDSVELVLAAERS